VGLFDGLEMRAHRSLVRPAVRSQSRACEKLPESYRNGIAAGQNGKQKFRKGGGFSLCT